MECSLPFRFRLIEFRQPMCGRGPIATVTRKVNILFIAPWFPYPPDRGITIRLYHLLRVLCKRHSVTLLAFVRPEQSLIDEKPLGFCRLVRTTAWRGYNPLGSKALAGFLSSRPRSLVDTYSPAMERLVRSQGETFDAVVSSTTDAAPYAFIAHARIRVLEEHNSMTRWALNNYQAAARPLNRLRAWLTYWKCRRYESKLYRGFDACTMVSDLDAAAVHELLNVHIPVGVIPNGVDLTSNSMTTIAPRPNTLIFNGSMTYDVNRQAIQWFLLNTWPLIKAKVPDATLTITGKTDDATRESLAGYEGIILSGHLEDVRPAVGERAVCVVPILSGGGTRVKILEAMALGTPVVATTKGAEGLGVTHGENILIGDDCAAFARETLRVLHDPDLRARLALNARRLVEARHDWNVSGGLFETFLLELLDGRKSETGLSRGVADVPIPA
jgi:glycosyltransferase involved in cell wall biosynthesis